MTSFSEAEVSIMNERGGYSGPQLFHRTLSLVKRYRSILDDPLHRHGESQQAQLQPHGAADTRIDGWIEHDAPNIKDPSDKTISQHPLRISERGSSYTKGGPGSDTSPALSTSNEFGQSSTSNASAALTRKVIFCSGGISNGQQALEVLNAGASVAQIYTGRCSSKY